MGTVESTRDVSPYRRLLEKFTVGDGCWLWTAHVSADGYGKVRWGRPRLAHRVIYEWLVGPIPEGLELDHLCRTRNCVRPDHLEPVTREENYRRGKKVALHVPASHCMRGHIFDEANTIRPPDGRRRCKECSLNRQRTRRARTPKANP